MYTMAKGIYNTYDNVTVLAYLEYCTWKRGRLTVFTALTFLLRQLKNSPLIIKRKCLGTYYLQYAVMYATFKAESAREGIFHPFHYSYWLQCGNSTHGLPWRKRQFVALIMIISLDQRQQEMLKFCKEMDNSGKKMFFWNMEKMGSTELK